MPRSRNLKGVAAALAGSFASRNNDVGGYWGIGLLCRDAMQGGDQAILDLRQRIAIPATPSSVHVTETYALRLEALLHKAGFSFCSLAGAEIALQFGEPSATHAHEVLFTCTVALTDSKGRRHAIVTRGQCWPHDPARELRSSRADGTGKSAST